MEYNEWANNKDRAIIKLTRALKRAVHYMSLYEASPEKAKENRKFMRDDTYIRNAFKKYGRLKK